MTQKDIIAFQPRSESVEEVSYIHGRANNYSDSLEVLWLLVVYVIRVLSISLVKLAKLLDWVTTIESVIM